MTPTSLSIAPTVAPSSSVGTDMTGQDQQFKFGDIYSGGSRSMYETIATNAIAGLVVAVAVKFVLPKLVK